MSGPIVPVILARTDSSRLPGKVLKPLLAGRSVIEELILQLKDIASDVPCIAAPIVATTDRPEDESVVREASALGVKVHTGHVMPLMRLHEIAMSNPHGWLWRINADSPLILSPLIKKAAEIISVVDDDVQVISNLVERSFPYGVSLELYRASLISGISPEQATPEELEHLTPLLQQLKPREVYSVVAGDLALSSFDPTVRLTIDEEEDALFFSSLWDDIRFMAAQPGSLERVDYAYRRRLSNAI